MKRDECEGRLPRQPRPSWAPGGASPDRPPEDGPGRALGGMSGEGRLGGVVQDELDRPLQPAGPIPQETVDETLLLLSWFRRHPDALRRTEPLERWA